MQILQLLNLLIDFGLVILIWMIQLIVYPSFINYTKENLIIWHKTYTKRIAVIVVPLMLGQLLFSIYKTITLEDFSTLMYLLMVLFLWIITLIKFAPMHQKITNGNFEVNHLISFVHLNWIRTISWTVLFLFNLFTMI